MKHLSLSPKQLRPEILGADFVFTTPFGGRSLVYADYTASGRNVRFIERYLTHIEECYANTHTEDDVTGRSTTEMLHQAEAAIKSAVNGNEDTCLIETGSGCTGAIKRLQEIIGVYIPPATRDRLGAKSIDRIPDERRPVVFIGPFEHHSNELSWRESLAEVVAVGLDREGGVDLADLERALARPRFANRPKIGSFSACSNVTGVQAPVFELARIMHRHGGLAFFDFAASAPYVRIDMNRDEDSRLDAVFFSPHKFLGGPGSPGILLFHRDIYRTDLPPTFAAGGTVDYVGPSSHEYIQDIEAREKAGTPPTIQLMRASLAIQLAQAIGIDRIEAIERRHTVYALEKLGSHPAIEILGPLAPERRIAIVSFNIRHGDRYLHPKLVTRLLNDLFGIQSRAGCSCAGPYGHHLLGIDEEKSRAYREKIRAGFLGIKPGWVRVGFHFTMDEAEVDYICRAITFLADHGPRFLRLYEFDIRSGAWVHEAERGNAAPRFGLEEALRLRDEEGRGGLSDEQRRANYARYLEEADVIAGRLPRADGLRLRPLGSGLEELAVFYVSRFAGEGDRRPI